MNKIQTSEVEKDFICFEIIGQRAFCDVHSGSPPLRPDLLLHLSMSFPIFLVGEAIVNHKPQHVACVLQDAVNLVGGY